MTHFFLKYRLALIVLIYVIMGVTSSTVVLANSGPIDCSKGFVCCSGPDCDFNAIVTNFEHIISQVLKYAFVFIAIMFAYAGYKYLTSKGDPGEITAAHNMFKDVVIGTMVVLLAYALIKTIITSLDLSQDVIKLE
jgi:hypothetical protein